jgi:peptidyl-prolyl cis-trans isomerase A (cyclophilin A)
MKIIFLVSSCIALACCSYAQPKDTLALLQLKAPAVYTVQMNTTLGSIIIQVNKKVAPLAADRFYQLVTSGFFDNTRLFRSNAKYLQFGINTDSAVNAFWERHPINDEPVIQKNSAGTISFATAGPNTRSASVYFNKTDNPKLDTLQKGTAFPSFGKIITGEDLLAQFPNRYVDSVVFKHWDSMAVKGNSYTDKVLPGLHRIVSMYVIAGKPAPTKHPARKTRKAKS